MPRPERPLAALTLLAALLFPLAAAAQEPDVDTDEIEADREAEAGAQEPAPPAEPVEEEYQEGTTTPLAPDLPAAPAPVAAGPPPANPYAAPAPAPAAAPPPAAPAPAAPAPAPVAAKKPQPLDRNGNVVGSEEAVEAEEKKHEDWPFNLFTVAPEVGYLIYPAADMEMQGITFTVNRRMGFVAKVHLDIGGAGFALDLAPLIEAEGANSFRLDAGSGVGGGLGGDYVGFGGELTLTYKFHVGKFFPHLGLGFHGTYLTSDALEYGSELFGRIPIGFTAYMGESVAFVFEFGFMYGVTGIRWKFTQAMRDALLADLSDQFGEEISADELPTDQAELEQFLAEHEDEIDAMENPEEAQAKLAQSIASRTISFGDGFGFDFMVGLRFP